MNPAISHLTIEDKKTINQEVGLLVKIEEGNSVEATLQDSDIPIIPERNLQNSIDIELILERNLWKLVDLEIDPEKFLWKPIIDPESNLRTCIEIIPETYLGNPIIFFSVTERHADLCGSVGIS